MVHAALAAVSGIALAVSASDAQLILGVVVVGLVAGLAIVWMIVNSLRR